MKKIISLIIFIIMLVWTWDLIHTDSSVPYETHAIIQTRLGEIIQQSVQKHRPEAQNFNLTRLWTQTLSADRIRAHFTYTFNEKTDEESSVQTISGEALLQKTSGEEQNQENWKVEKVVTNSNQVVFQEGLIVGPEAEPTEGTTPTTEPKTEAPATGN